MICRRGNTGYDPVTLFDLLLIRFMLPGGLVPALPLWVFIFTPQEQTGRIFAVFMDRQNTGALIGLWIGQMDGFHGQYCGWTKSNSHHFKTRVETTVCWYLRGRNRIIPVVSDAKWNSQPSGQAEAARDASGRAQDAQAAALEISQQRNSMSQHEFCRSPGETGAVPSLHQLRFQVLQIPQVFFVLHPGIFLGNDPEWFRQGRSAEIRLKGRSLEYFADVRGAKWME